MGRSENNLYEFGPFHLDTAERLLLRDSLPVPLAPKIFDTLVALVQHSGHLLTKDELMQKVWPDSFVEEVNLTVNISALRKALGDDQNGQRYIDTVPKKGYRFVAPVRELSNNGAESVVEKRIKERIGAEEEESGVLGENVKAKQSVEEEALAAGRGVDIAVKWRLSQGILAACLLLAAFASALSYVWVSSRRKQHETVAGVRSIAVLPFKSLETEGGGEYFGLEMADTLITKLGNVRQIIVRPTSAVLKYATPEQDPVAIGQEQKVDAVLEASIRRIGERILVTAQLVSVTEGRPLWADNFEEKFTDILAIEDQVTDRVARSLTIKLTGKEMAPLTKRYPENTEAFHLYVNGRLSSTNWSAKGWKESLNYYGQAIIKDPTYAPAYAGLATTYVLLGERGLLPPEEDWLKKADSAALKALEIDDTLPEAHTSLGMVRLQEWHLSAAELAFKRALEFNPVSAQTYHYYAYYLQYVGRFDEAVIYIKREQALDPVSVTVNGLLAKCFLRASRLDEAIDQYQKVLQIYPNFVPAHNNLAGAYAAKGMYEKAIAEIKKSITLDNSPQRRGQLAQLGRIYALSGRRDEARKALDELMKQSKTVYIPAYNFALIYEALDDRERAFAWLEKAFVERDLALIGLRMEGFDSLRSDPKFTDLLRRIEAACR